MGTAQQETLDAFFNEPITPLPLVQLSRHLPSEWLAAIELADMDGLKSMLKGLTHQRMNSHVRRRVRRSIEAAIELRKRAARQTMAEVGGSFIRDKLREVGFTRSLFPPSPLDIYPPVRGWDEQLHDMHQKGQVSEATYLAWVALRVAHT